MKPFNLKEWEKTQRKVVTEKREPVRIICTDRKGDEYNIVYLVDKGFSELYGLVDSNGKSPAEVQYLYFAPEEKSGFVNLYRTWSGAYWVGSVYDTKEEAIKNSNSSAQAYVDTIHISWEEQ